MGGVVGFVWGGGGGGGVVGGGGGGGRCSTIRNTFMFEIPV